MVKNLLVELADERERVDRLKRCLEQVHVHCISKEHSEKRYILILEYRTLEISRFINRCLVLVQEREKTEILLVKSKSEGNQPGSDLQQEWIVFNQRRFEGLEIAKEQLNRELKRQRTLNSRMGEEIEHLRGQLRTSGGVSVKSRFF